MINIDVKRLERWFLQEIADRFVDHEGDLKLANLDRDDRQLQVARAWTTAVLEVLAKYSNDGANNSK